MGEDERSKIKLILALCENNQILDMDGSNSWVRGYDAGRACAFHEVLALLRGRVSPEGAKKRRVKK